MSKIEDKAVDIMDKAMVGAERLTEKLAELAAQYGPDVVNAAIEVARITALRPIIGGAVCAVVSYVLLRFSIKAFQTAKADDWDNPVYIVGCGFSGIISSGFGTAAAIYLFDVWNWVGVFEPKLWIAHRILEKAL